MRHCPDFILLLVICEHKKCYVPLFWISTQAACSSTGSWQPCSSCLVGVCGMQLEVVVGVVARRPVFAEGNRRLWYTVRNGL